MNDTMSMVGGMGFGMTLGGVLVLVLLILGIAALAKYIFFRSVRKRSQQADGGPDAST